MKIVEPEAIIRDSLDEHEILYRLEMAGRTAYKSEDSMTADSAKAFVRRIIKSGHESVLEHVSISVCFIIDRGVSHELVRHRIAAYTQESTRYVNYQKKGMVVIKPCFWEEGSLEYAVWYNHMIACEAAYNQLIRFKAKPQQARSVLPNSLKTEIVTTMNLREWRHVMRLRTAPNAHPQMQQVMKMLLAQFRKHLPVIFEDVGNLDS